MAPNRLRLCCGVTFALLACSPETRPDDRDGDVSLPSRGSGTDRAMSGSAGVGTGHGSAGRNGGSSGHGGAGTGGTGMDGGASGADAGQDAGPDAGGCATQCSGTAPVCDADAGECIPCTNDDDCDDDLHCASDGSCAQCASDQHCPDLALPFCNPDTGACQGCIGHDSCERFEDTPYCHFDTGRCVTCTPETEPERCGDYSCDRATGGCTTTERGSVLACNACQADSECGTGMKCVEHVFGGESLGSFCFFEKGSAGCADTNLQARPYGRQVEATSVDQVSGTWCLPITSCQALFDATAMGQNGGKSCSVSEECGLSDVNDGYCLDVGTGTKQCSYICNNSYECPQGGFILTHPLISRRANLA